MSGSSGSSGSSVEVTWEDWLHLRNYVWRQYRVKGTPTDRNDAQRQAIYERHDRHGPPPLPDPARPAFFENMRWERQRYLWNQDTNNALIGLPGPDQNPDSRDNLVRARHREITTYFGKPRHHVQRILGVGGNGIAIHFKDRGPGHDNDPGRDFVVKLALENWQSDEIVEEKMMMRKVKGSAHCVQVIDPPDVGKPEEEPVVLPLADFDSSTDGDSSGNESLSRAEVSRKHVIPKRRRRNPRHWEIKRQRKIAREAEIEREMRRQGKRRMRRDYIIMEYLQHGNLASLIFKLNEHEREDGHVYEVPNRVLWGFWLCLIRACIAMEYPPRKFHPHRKRPVPGNAVDYLKARMNKMVRDLKGLGIPLIMPGGLEGDLIEDLPARPGGPRQWKLQRRQNMIHRDMDATNIFVNGLELDGPGVVHWQENKNAISQTADDANPGDQDKTESKNKSFEYTDKRPDRINHEHDLIPRLKLGDFGQAVCIKREKTNEYYHAYREGGKHGEYPPEHFGPEWQQIEVDRYGDQLADSRTCGYYSNKTNIWASALTMWELITKLQPPTPPAPQPPYSEVLNFPPYNDQGQTNMDLIFDDPQYAEFKISYCALLRDPTVTDYDWVDENLRDTIFRCMYHKPNDRPSLEELLSQAERNVEVDASGESDEYIREWIQYWFFDAPRGGGPRPPGGPLPPGGKPRPGGQPPAPPGGQLPVPPAGPPYTPPILLPASPIPFGVGLNLHPNLQHLLDELNKAFPHGYDRIFNPGTGLRCGLYAIRDSLRSQLGLHPTINGVTHHINSLPTLQDLFQLYYEMRDNAQLDDLMVLDPNLLNLENISIELLGALLTQWARQNNLE
ncbi:hypothetical protein F4859DRAFT_528879 [Xylaria cf. heliscus]|nr:hypothetical protein F4859DRAFT_528879 [Xylaria cf. heliscus]